ncbi:EAL domain-containing protein [Thioalkalivibrio sp. ALJ15]|uniref:EAL domain-containing protein n=1 Tax=Thioalkalivibrio sp. ALJ15 TaxID=748652 RepID=UPI0003818DEB|nr:EAL domain-containing protein [Thioalkalivibrio sp. ALJ15]
MHVLVVEDQAADADLQRRSIERGVPSAQVVVADTLKGAREALADQTFDCALVDLRLPDGNGLDLVAELRDQGRPEAVIVLTGHGEQETVIAAFRSGADDYLTKAEGYLERLPTRIVDARSHRDLRVSDPREPLAVLYVEHNEFDIGLARRELARRAPNIHLTVQRSAEAALEVLPTSPEEPLALDLLLVDYRLPAMDGLELARIVRHERGLDLPVVLLTGQGTEDLAARALRMGVDDYVLKSEGYLKGLPAVLDQVHVHARLRRERAALAASERRYREVIEQAGNVFFYLDQQGRWVFANPAWSEITGFVLEQTLGRPLVDFVVEEDRGRVGELVREVLETGETGGLSEVRLQTREGGIRWCELRLRARQSERDERPFTGTLIDVTERVRNQRIQEIRANILDRIATGERDPALLEDLVLGLESLNPDLHGCVMLVDADGDQLVGAAGPRIPETLRSVTSPIPVADGVGSCGTAAWSGEPVLVEDTQSHPYWAGLEEATAQAGFRACWSFPFRDADGYVLGTFAVYLAAARLPRPEERDQLEEFARLAALAVQKLRAWQALEQRERSLEAAAGLSLNLLRNENPSVVMSRLLGELGRVTGADRTYVMMDAGPDSERETLEQHRFFWVNPEGDPPIRPPSLRHLSLESVLPQWDERLRAGEIIQARIVDLPDGERELFESVQTRALLLAPLFVRGEYRGFVGLDRVRQGRIWGAADEHMVRIVAANLGAALERRRALTGLRRLAAVFQSTRDGILITDLSARIVAVNPAFSEITGFSEHDALGRNPRFLKSGRHDAEFYQEMWASLVAAGHWQGEVWNRRSTGETDPQWLSLDVVRDEGGEPQYYAGVLTDLSALKRSQNELEYLAQHDSLTDLPNRSQLQTLLGRALERARAERRGLAVLCLDLDRFKTLNDSLGHSVGDRVLLEVARRLADVLESPDLLGRLGGDEFLAVLESADTHELAEERARALLEVLQRPFVLDDGQVVYVNASIGVSRFPGDGDTVVDLMQHADAAMYQAKALGRETWSFYTEDLTQAAAERLDLENRLRHALNEGNGELAVHFQPQVRLVDGRLTGVEALVRWHSGSGESIRPDRFIPIAEETGLVVPLGEWVLREACRQGRQLLDEVSPDLVMSVNLSPVQLRRGNLVEQVRQVLEETGFPARQLEFEITETGLMQQGDQAVTRLKALKSLGVRVAIDDFGTGYSSLAVLQNFPLDVLKIDRSFVDGVDRMDEEGTDRLIASTIIAMARNLQLEVIAEGVENEAQACFLIEHGCEFGQGYLYSPALPSEQLLEWAARRVTSPA